MLQAEHLLLNFVRIIMSVHTNTHVHTHVQKGRDNMKFLITLIFKRGIYTVFILNFTVLTFHQK